MTTEKAFKKLLESPELWHGKILDSNVRSWRKRLADGNLVTLTVMERALKKAGAKKKPEVWTFPK